MRVMVIGGGGREHALAFTLAKSPRVDDILCVPGNAGTAAIGVNIDVKVDDHRGLAALARERDVDLTVVGPEGPLCAGIVDCFEAEGLRIFGPTKAAARIEGNKAYVFVFLNELECRCVNLELIREGLLRADSDTSIYAHHVLLQAQKEAQDKGRGIWGKKSERQK